MTGKIFKIDDLQIKLKSLKECGKTIVLSLGHFNVIHPGHLRFLSSAKKLGDYLVVAIQHESELLDFDQTELFSQVDRAQGVAALELVDAVYMLNGSVVDFIKEIKPNYYVKGREFESKKNLIKKEIEAIESVGGEIVFSSGDLKFSNNLIKETDFGSSKWQRAFLQTCASHKIDFAKILDTIDLFDGKKFLVIGDSIVDQFVACDVLGASSEAPVLAIREIESKEFIGGAAAVARHVKSLGAQCNYISIIGDDDPGNKVIENLAKSGVHASLYTDYSRPTTYKIRYMVDNQKVLRVSRLKQHQLNMDIEETLLERLEVLLPQMDGVIISDFVYGVISEKILHSIEKLSHKHNVKVFGDLQCSSQIGDVSKFKNIELITPTEKEARIALHDYTSGLETIARELIKRTQNNSVIITLASEGFLVYSKKQKDGSFKSEYFPALESNPIDVAGAGDSLLTGLALGLTCDLDILEASAMAACLAGISVMRIGNVPITKQELKNYINNISKFYKK